MICILKVLDVSLMQNFIISKSFESIMNIVLGWKFFKVYQNLITMSLFLSFLFSPFLPCKVIFMDDYDGI